MPRGTVLPSGGGGTVLPTNIQRILDQISQEDKDWVLYDTGDEEKTDPLAIKVKGFVMFCEDFIFEGKEFVNKQPLKFKVNESELNDLIPGVCGEPGVTHINFSLKKPVVGGIYADKIDKI